MKPVFYCEAELKQSPPIILYARPSKHFKRLRIQSSAL